MQPDFEIAWHGAAWRDDRLEVPPPPVVTAPEGLCPQKRPHEHRGGRKPVIAAAVVAVLRAAEKPLSAVEVFERLPNKKIGTIAGVNGAIYRLKKDGKVERGERAAQSFGRFSCTYQWVRRASSSLDQVKLQARKAEIGRLGGLKSGEARRKAASC